jgi:hypothetical protein
VQEVKISTTSSQRHLSHPKATAKERIPSNLPLASSSVLARTTHNPLPVHLVLRDNPEAGQSMSESAVSTTLVSPSPTPP